MSHKTINRILTQFSGGRIVAVPRPYMELLGGDATAALLLSQLVYWSDKCGEDGWFYKSDKEIEIETGLSQFRTARARNDLRDLKLIETAVRKVGKTPKMHYRVNLTLLVDMLVAEPDAQAAKSCETSQAACPPEASGVETPEAYFDKLDEEKVGKRSFAAHATIEERKERITTALAAHSNRSKSAPDLANYLARIPENVRGIARAFCIGFGRPPIKKEDGYWRSEWSNQAQLGLTENDVTAAINRMRRDGLTIKSPQSITAVAEDEKHKRVEKKVSSGDAVVFTSPASKKYIGGQDGESKD